MSRLVRVITAVVAAFGLVALSSPQIVTPDHSTTAGGAIGCCKLR